ncbi:MAG: DMT family transporter [Lachnospiraceae bacterium]|nr:DMT family transporter [Lachnospiraceae bacterium]
MNQKNIIGGVYALISIIAGSSMFIACKIAYEATLGGFTLLFFRYILATLVLFIIYRNRPKPTLTKSDKKSILFIGIFGYWFSISLVLIGAAYCDASTAAIISSLNPIGMILFGAIFLKEKSNLGKITGVLVSVVGSIIVIGAVGEGNTVFGIAISFCSMVRWALTSAFIRKSCTSIDAVWLTIYATTVGMICDIPFAVGEMIIGDFELHSYTAPVLFAIVWIGIVSTAGANLWWSKALEILPLTTCSLSFSLMPVTSTILSVIILKEVLTIKFLIGCFVIMIGIIVALLSDSRAKE